MPCVTCGGAQFLHPGTKYVPKGDAGAGWKVTFPNGTFAVYYDPDAAHAAAASYGGTVEGPPVEKKDVSASAKKSSSSARKRKTKSATPTEQDDSVSYDAENGESEGAKK